MPENRALEATLACALSLLLSWLIH